MPPAISPSVFAEFELAPAVASEPGLRNAVEQASLILEGVVRGSKRPISVRWDRLTDNKGDYVTVRLKDSIGEAEEILPVDILDSIPKLRRRFSDLYDNLLRIRLQYLDRQAATGEES